MKLIERVIDNPSEKYVWIEILGDMHAAFVKEVLTKNDISVLKRCLEFHGDIELTHWYDGPHSNSPDYFIRQFAAEMLYEHGFDIPLEEYGIQK